MSDFIIDNFMDGLLIMRPMHDDVYKNAYKYLRMRHSIVAIMRNLFGNYMTLGEYVNHIKTTLLHDMNIVTPYFIVFTYGEIFGRKNLIMQLSAFHKRKVYEECEFYSELDKKLNNTISQTLLPLI